MVTSTTKYGSPGWVIPGIVGPVAKLVTSIVFIRVFIMDARPSMGEKVLAIDWSWK
jgi:hypothetical protein